MKTLILSVGLAIAIDAFGETRVPLAPMVAPVAGGAANTVQASAPAQEEEQKARKCRKKRRSFRGLLGSSARLLAESAVNGYSQDK